MMTVRSVVDVAEWARQVKGWLTRPPVDPGEPGADFTLLGGPGPVWSFSGGE